MNVKRNDCLCFALDFHTHILISFLDDFIAVINLLQLESKLSLYGWLFMHIGLCCLQLVFGPPSISKVESFYFVL